MRALRGAPFLWQEINFSQGNEWKALMRRYIMVIPLIGDELSVAMHGMSGWPSKKALHSAISAKVGAAARPSQKASPTAPLPPMQVLAS